jgi:hypothetical protein
VKKRQTVSVNPVVQSLDIVYTAAPSVDGSTTNDDNVPNAVDPSGVAVSFQSAESFTAEEKATR